MGTIEKIEQMIQVAEGLGYQIRYEYFGGTGGGICEVGGNKWLFIDLALSSNEQMEQFELALQDDPSFAALNATDNTPKNIRRAA